MASAAAGTEAQAQDPQVFLYVIILTKSPTGELCSAQVSLWHIVFLLLAVDSCSALLTHGQEPVTQEAFAVTRVAGDGDCLFHALAFFDASDGGALRIEVADFMEAHAEEQNGFEAAWFREASKLRASKWGGHTAITAYSLMKSTRVMLHTHHAEDGRVTVEEVSHGSIWGHPASPIQHILYNNRDHYDAWAEIVDLTGMVPSWPQQALPVYFSPPNDDKPSKPSARPPGKKKGRGKGKAKAKPAPSKAEGTSHDAETPEKAPAPRDDEEDDWNQPGLTEALQSIPVAESSLHPQRQVEDLIKDIAGTRRFMRPLLPFERLSNNPLPSV